MTEVVQTTPQRLRLGVVGGGRVFERLHLPALLNSPDWTLTSVSERLAERRRWLRHRFPHLALHESTGQLLNDERPEALLVASPPSFHPELSVQALEAGCHVLVEKPMALDIQGASRMAAAAQRASKLVWVGFNRRFRRPYHRLKHLLEELPAASIQSVFYQLSLDAGGWNSITPFLGDDLAGGGILDDVVSHQADLLPWLLNRHVQRVRAVMQTRGQKKVLAVAMVLDGGLEAKCLAAHAGIYREHVEVRLPGQTLLAHPAGLLKLRRPPSATILAACRWFGQALAAYCKFTRTPSDTQHSMQAQWAAFAAAVRRPGIKSDGCTARQGLGSVAVVEACRHSLQNGGKWQNLDGQGGPLR